MIRVYITSRVQPIIPSYWRRVGHMPLTGPKRRSRRFGGQRPAAERSWTRRGLRGPLASFRRLGRDRAKWMLAGPEPLQDGGLTRESQPAAAWARAERI